jgi:hypothetical protein
MFEDFKKQNRVECLQPAPVMSKDDWMLILQVFKIRYEEARYSPVQLSAAYEEKMPHSKPTTSDRSPKDLLSVMQATFVF